MSYSGAQGTWWCVLAPLVIPRPDNRPKASFRLHIRATDSMTGQLRPSLQMRSVAAKAEVASANPARSLTSSSLRSAPSRDHQRSPLTICGIPQFSIGLSPAHIDDPTGMTRNDCPLSNIRYSRLGELGRAAGKLSALDALTCARRESAGFFTFDDELESSGLLIDKLSPRTSPHMRLRPALIFEIRRSFRGDAPYDQRKGKLAVGRTRKLAGEVRRPTPSTSTSSPGFIYRIGRGRARYEACSHQPAAMTRQVTKTTPFDPLVRLAPPDFMALPMVTKH